jgi:hypothetical protein
LVGDRLRLGVGHARNRPARSLHPGRGGRTRLPATRTARSPCQAACSARSCGPVEGEVDDGGVIAALGPGLLPAFRVDGLSSSPSSQSSASGCAGRLPCHGARCSRSVRPGSAAQGPRSGQGHRDFPDDSPRGAAAGANLACTRPAADVPAMRPYAFTPPLGGGAAWSRAQGLPGLSTTPPGRDSGLPGWPGGAWT